MELFVSKLLVAAFLGFVRFSTVYCPVKIYNVLHGQDEECMDNFLNPNSRKWFNFSMATLHSFGAGVMLCTCLIHLVTSVHSSFANVMHTEKSVSSCQYSQLLICAGFFMIYFIEEIGQWIVTKVPSKPFLTTSDYSSTSTSRGDTVISNISDHLKCQNSKAIRIEKTESSEEKTDDSTNNFIVINKKEFVKFVFTEVAVGLHALFEGLAIGLQCSIINIMYLSIGMTIHSITSLLCLGLNFIVARASKKLIIGHFVILSMTTPVGIILGLLISISDLNFEDREILNSYMEALSAGNITYITFFETLSKEKKNKCNKIYRNLAMMVGFSLMCYLEYFTFDNLKKNKHIF